MNGIVLLAKEIELQDYKLIYPNDKNLKVIFTDNYTVVRLITGSDSNELNFLEKLFNSNKLFITGDIYQSFTLSLELDSRNLNLEFHSGDNKLIKYFSLKEMKLTNSKFEEVKISHAKRIKEIYFNENLASVVIVIDENFCSAYERQELKAIAKRRNELEVEKAEKENLLKDVKDLLKWKDWIWMK